MGEYQMTTLKAVPVNILRNRFTDTMVTMVTMGEGSWHVATDLQICHGLCIFIFNSKFPEISETILDRHRLKQKLKPLAMEPDDNPGDHNWVGTRVKNHHTQVFASQNSLYSLGWRYPGIILDIRHVLKSISQYPALQLMTDQQWQLGFHYSAKNMLHYNLDRRQYAPFLLPPVFVGYRSIIWTSHWCQKTQVLLGS